MFTELRIGKKDDSTTSRIATFCRHTEVYVQKRTLAGKVISVQGSPLLVIPTFPSVFAEYSALDTLH